MRTKKKHDSIEFAIKSHTTKCVFVYFICFGRYFFTSSSSMPMTTTKKMQIVELRNSFVVGYIQFGNF